MNTRKLSKARMILILLALFLSTSCTMGDMVIVPIAGNLYDVCLLYTSRANRQKKKGHMGIGLENVRRTLAVYHGTLQCEETGGEYRVSIMLPKKEEL